MIFTGIINRKDLRIALVKIGKRSISYRKVLMGLSDLSLSIIALWFALQLHTDGPSVFNWRAFVSSAAIFAGSGLIIFTIMGFYEHIWRFSSTMQYLSLLWGALIQTVCVYIFMRLRGDAYSLEVYIIYSMIIFLLITGSRVAYRVGMSNATFRAIMYRRPLPTDKTAPQEVLRRRRVMVIGAGVTGSQIVREMQLSSIYEPVILIDDNPLTHRYKVLGVAVYGSRDAIPDAVVQFKVDIILLAIPSASKETIRELISICSKTHCELKMIPLLQNLIDCHVSMNDIKDVDIEDLLGRDEVVLDTNLIAGYLTGAVVLVTGGGGSIGSELCRQIARYHPKQLIIFDIYENNAFLLQNELKEFYLLVLVGSVRDKLRLQTVFAQYRPDVIFHAAAHKHVPLMEDSPSEAVKNNIMGTFNVALTAAEFGVRRFVLISTDKAVNPTNVMGATKRIAEMLVQTLSTQHPGTRFAAVRFGNVLGSSGSVIPLFKQQIQNERRVTVTHPDITRYFMTIPEAARLVIQAGAIVTGGEIFVLDMGEPMKIADLARDLIRLSGLKPDVDVQVVFTGLRPGEKMYEELFLDKENMGHTQHQKILTLKPLQDRQELLLEMERLKATIRWENEKFAELMNWLITHFTINNAFSNETNDLAKR
jgi:FlaA1/EpsC-like NDP-sugar epimerase